MGLEFFTTSELHAELDRRNKSQELAINQAKIYENNKEEYLRKHQKITDLIKSFECLNQPSSFQKEQLELLYFIRAYILSTYEDKYLNEYPLAYKRSLYAEVNQSRTCYFLNFVHSIDSDGQSLPKDEAKALSVACKESKNRATCLFVLSITAELALIAAGILAISFAVASIPMQLPLVFIYAIILEPHCVAIILGLISLTALAAAAACFMFSEVSKLYDDLVQCTYYNNLIDRIDALACQDPSEESGNHPKPGVLMGDHMRLSSDSGL